MSRGVRDAAPLWRQWTLIWTFAQRDLKSKYKGTLLGWVWSLTVPLASLLIYTVIFGGVFEMTPPSMGSRAELAAEAAGDTGNFAVWLFAGLVVWGFMANSVNAAMNGLLGTGSLLKKIYFPSYAPALGAVAGTGVQSSIELGLLAVVLLLMGNLGWTWLLLPVWLVIFVLFVTGVSTALAILNVYTRDMAHLVGVALQLLFYATPIIYPLSMITDRDVPGSVVERYHLADLYQLNPMVQFIELFRDLLYGLQPGPIAAWGQAAAWAAVATLWAVVVFRRRGADVGEMI